MKKGPAGHRSPSLLKRLFQCFILGMLFQSPSREAVHYFRHCHNRTIVMLFKHTVVSLDSPAHKLQVPRGTRELTQSSLTDFSATQPRINFSMPIWASSTGRNFYQFRTAFRTVDYRIVFHHTASAIVLHSARATGGHTALPTCLTRSVLVP